MATRSEREGLLEASNCVLKIGEIPEPLKARVISGTDARENDWLVGVATRSEREALLKARYRKLDVII